ncbi:uncharacterized protein LOC105704246 [Orussus abietinus]|uniref:uncharacterized protein LOC105704246 n=1 Tax=Orussus abietinus TaxID=222816 RepID=UPI0006266CDF|nr:uncharacterized protein LOC105704246 [Orussus abietinus]
MERKLRKRPKLVIIETDSENEANSVIVLSDSDHEETKLSYENHKVKKSTNLKKEKVSKEDVEEASSKVGKKSSKGIKRKKQDTGDVPKLKSKQLKLSPDRVKNSVDSDVDNEETCTSEYTRKESTSLKKEKVAKEDVKEASSKEGKKRSKGIKRKKQNIGDAPKLKSKQLKLSPDRIKNSADSDVDSEKICKSEYTTTHAKLEQKVFEEMLPPNSDTSYPEKNHVKVDVLNQSTEDEKNVKKKINIAKIEEKFKNVSCREWSEAQYLSEIHNIDEYLADNVVKLFNDENTIPFIARYRKNMTGGMEAEMLRVLKESYERAKLVKHRAANIIKTIDKLGKWTPEVHAFIKAAKSIEELDHVSSLYKTASKSSLAERARALGLGIVSATVLQGDNLPDLSSLVDVNKDGLQNIQQVKEGIVNILADVLSKNQYVFEMIRELQKTPHVQIETKQAKIVKSKKEKDETIKDDKTKYDIYFNFKTTERNIKPHQILAINRGESQKILSVKIHIPDWFEQRLKNHCLNQFQHAQRASQLHHQLLEEGFGQAYKRLIKPLITRRVRRELSERAETASIEVFATNLKQLLLVPPVRGKIVLGVDPGFRHGCKLAAVSEHGTVLECATIYPHSHSSQTRQEAEKILIKLVCKHQCTVLALGNATACRETEVFLTDLIQANSFAPLDVSYVIIDEAGASIYSCGNEAKSEFPNLDPNLISAVSIARRLQDPLAELVKVEPKHLGVGMYQHDLPEKQLVQTLNEVVSEAVSFVGVDINTASLCLLKRVAGLNVGRASKIIEWRNQHGPFTDRKQLTDVKGIGNKSFEQCVGFIRIMPKTALTKKSKNSSQELNYLDQTCIHPESYSVAEHFLKYCGCNIEDLGTENFIMRIKSCVRRGSEALAKMFETNKATMDLIIQGLTMKLDDDIRLKNSFPTFKKSLTSIDDLKSGTALFGTVRNVTHFGAFVDIGVGNSGLIPTRMMKGQTLSIGQQLEVKVISIERERQRISLEFIKIIQ